MEVETLEIKDIYDWLKDTLLWNVNGGGWL